jgi:hypothetical protein
LTPSESSAPSKSSQPSLSTAPSQVPSTSRYGKSSKARYWLRETRSQLFLSPDYTLLCYCIDFC